ncbi:hypothetical protein Taro_044932 [Colocasia esculenta]|uniref:RRM domain-containing protein n=1 Tax=Colocasia esculenta TaxID=4460 RepID=A0A843WPY6_COLES|nr:hypothetical protein [Colocasia esculenta]
MMQPAAGMVPQPMAPPPMDQQHPPQPQQQWAPMMHPQYHQPPPQMAPPPMWNQQPSQVPPPQPMAPPQPQPVQMGPPQPQQMQQQVQYHQVATAPAPAPAAPSPQLGSADEIRSLWVGDLQYWMDETYIHSCFASAGEAVSVKVIRNKQTGQSEGYGFIEFANRAGAERVLQSFNGQLMPNAEQTFRLNWASYGAGERRSEDNDHPIFVGDLAADVTDYMLQETFRARYPSVKGAKVVTDRITGRSKGYGFVRFADVNEQNRALTEMNGVFLSTRPMRVGPATMKKTSGTGSNLKDIKGKSKRWGDIDFLRNEKWGAKMIACAEEALLMLNGAQLGGQNIRLSWGRSPSSKQPQQDPNQWSGGYYGYGQGYDATAYGYAPPPQDPNMYAYGAYPGYGNYPQQQQQQYPQQQQ